MRALFQRVLCELSVIRSLRFGLRHAQLGNTTGLLETLAQEGLPASCKTAADAALGLGILGLLLGSHPAKSVSELDVSLCNAGIVAILANLRFLFGFSHNEILPALFTFAVGVLFLLAMGTYAAVFPSNRTLAASTLRILQRIAGPALVPFPLSNSTAPTPVMGYFPQDFVVFDYSLDNGQPFFLGWGAWLTITAGWLCVLPTVAGLAIHLVLYVRTLSRVELKRAIGLALLSISLLFAIIGVSSICWSARLRTSGIKRVLLRPGKWRQI